MFTIYLNAQEVSSTTNFNTAEKMYKAEMNTMKVGDILYVQKDGKTILAIAP